MSSVDMLFQLLLFCRRLEGKQKGEGEQSPNGSSRRMEANGTIIGYVLVMYLRVSDEAHDRFDVRGEALKSRWIGAKATDHASPLLAPPGPPPTSDREQASSPNPSRKIPEGFWKSQGLRWRRPTAVAWTHLSLPPSLFCAALSGAGGLTPGQPTGSSNAVRRLPSPSARPPLTR
uniref:Uncharacterized protein n=1 Tax=Coccidioides posadasii RMSCC 3488 TaxID=454284 RepID=A0A0J6EZD7_COCPO|nr:hypothetical protein CPAG_02307 [Coccidioides posadasii RMSCC 3488]